MSRDQITVLWTSDTKYSASRDLNIVSHTDMDSGSIKKRNTKNSVSGDQITGLV